MNEDDWLNKVKYVANDLRSLILNYHPATRSKGSGLKTGAEKACAGIRDAIAGKFIGSPVERFDLAIEDRDTDTIRSILSDTWFGVPESTSCWQIRGFADCVDLIEDD